MLLKDWKLKYKEYDEFKCKAPCSLYSVLLENHLIDDPFYGTNEYKIRELCEDDCEFTSVFIPEDKVLKDSHAVLRFHGLDSICKVFLNGIFLGKTENMHRIYDFECTNILKPGENILKLHFKSPLRYIADKDRLHKVWSSKDCVQGTSQIRKASYMLGWDWGPTLPDMGIFRDAELFSYDESHLENINIRQLHSENSVKLFINLEGKGKLDGTVTIESEDLVLSAETENGSAEITIDNPKLWWPNGYGEQPLYKITAVSGEDRLEKNIGLRTLTVSTERDKYGEEFCFVINNIKIFAMGADYIPQDNILSRVNYGRAEALIKDCIKANFNCLRVWGGGYYPEDYFYDLCDKYGLIIWQDFMFACNNVYLSKNFTENITDEFKDNLKRIRHHACIGLLCGNNEMETAVMNWQGVSTELVKMDYLMLYEHILPDICSEYAPDIYYIPSSPTSGGGFDNPDDENRGDAHYWSVWAGRLPFTDYRKHYFRFLSEFGFCAYPSLKTIKSFAGSEDSNPFSEVMESHFKSPVGSIRILDYISENYLYPTSIEDLVYVSQLNQAKAIEYGVEHLRRNRGRCMGATYWQINDCWPVISWSSIDYYGRWKALHYAAKRFFAPVLLSACDEEYSVALNVVNETRKTFNGSVEYKVIDSDFNEYFSGKADVKIPELKSTDIVKLDLEEYVSGCEKERIFVYILKDSKGKAISCREHLFTVPKRFKYKAPVIDVKVVKNGNIAEFILKSDKFAQSVELDFDDIDVKFSDNYFSILSPKEVVITAETEASLEELTKVKIKAVNYLK